MFPSVRILPTIWPRTFSYVFFSGFKSAGLKKERILHCFCIFHEKQQFLYRNL